MAVAFYPRSVDYQFTVYIRELHELSVDAQQAAKLAVEYKVDDKPQSMGIPIKDAL